LEGSIFQFFLSKLSVSEFSIPLSQKKLSNDNLIIYDGIKVIPE